ncbi:response regulator [Exiguobacterium sp. s16]|uniref:response regulator n=1 Tax=Exiguobacterium sp. s16 TaxID=2751237 RepID=UPI0020373997|nr:response regulator [Exiguobacterium sp. s16]
MITLCIADDNREIVDLLTRQLESEDDLKVVGTAYDGEACLDVVKTHQPDVLLLDIIMPHLDGIGVLERLQTELAHAKPEVIMLSAFGKDEVTKQAVQLGASYFLVKPFNIQQLITKIRELAAGSSRCRQKNSISRCCCNNSGFHRASKGSNIFVKPSSTSESVKSCSD